MSMLTLEHLDGALNSLRRIFEEDKEALEYINGKALQLKEAFNVEAVNYCFGKYIEAELDTETSGDRGIGRLSTSIPRLGAYFRKQIRTLSSTEKEYLHELIQNIMLSAYLVHALFMEKNTSHVKLSGKKEIYEKWLPRIYLSHPSELKEDVNNAIQISTTPDFEKLYEFFKIHKMKGGGFLKNDKIGSILVYYCIAGFGLRVLEFSGG